MHEFCLLNRGVELAGFELGLVKEIEFVSGNKLVFGLCHQYEYCFEETGVV